MQKRPKIIMAGTFPPPTHGMSAINNAVRCKLTKEGVDLTVINLAAPSLSRSVWMRLLRLPRVFVGLCLIGFSRGLRNRTLYISVSSGYGQIYDIAFLVIARLRGMRIFMHHHSYAYLDSPNRLTALMIKSSGQLATHIVLSSGMADRLKFTYLSAKKIVAVSNSAILDLGGTGELAGVRKRLRTIGYLSNISQDKGINEFLEVCSVLANSRLGVRAKLAGPFKNRAIEDDIRERLKDIPNIEYVGPKYGKDKLDFYAQVDAFLFPTNYFNEAEPLVIHEALRAGLPVIANKRGSIAEIINNDCGVVVPIASEFVSLSFQHIRNWVEDDALLERASRAALDRAARCKEENMVLWDKLRKDMMS